MNSLPNRALTVLTTFGLAVALFFTGRAFLSPHLESRPANEKAYAAQHISQNATGLMPLALSPEAPAPSPGSLETSLSKIFNNSATYTATIVDALKGDTLYSNAGDTAVTPASNLKLLTAAAALRELGPNQRFETKIVLNRDKTGIIIVGGGDVLLGEEESEPDAVVGRVGLKTLAEESIKSLENQGLTGPFSIHYDASLYDGETLNPHWPQEDLDHNEMTALYPLAVNAAKPSDGSQRPRNPALQAAQMLAEALQNQGLAVVDRLPTALFGNVFNTTGNNKTTSHDGNKEASKESEAPFQRNILARGESATVAEQIKYALEQSDNYLSENLGHLIALAAGKTATYSNAAASIVASVAHIGLDAEQLHLVDASGLAADNKISTAQLAALIRIIINSPDPALRHVLEGLSIAHLSGSLKNRYNITPEAAGIVRAKTGTLTRTKSLTGYVVDADNRLLVFSFIANDTLADDKGPQDAIDQAAAFLTSCGCR